MFFNKKNIKNKPSDFINNEKILFSCDITLTKTLVEWFTNMFIICSGTIVTEIRYTIDIQYQMGLDAGKPVFGGLRTTKAQTSLRIRAVWSAPLFFAYWKVSYLDLLRPKFQFSSLSL